MKKILIAIAFVAVLVIGTALLFNQSEKVSQRIVKTSLNRATVAMMAE